MSEQEREHVASMDCWCSPVAESYPVDVSEAGDDDEA